MAETAGWIPNELPAGTLARRTLAEVALPPSPAERAAQREEARNSSAPPDTGSGADEANFIARMNGHAPRDRLAEAAAESPGRDRAELDDQKRAAEVLKPFGLAHVIRGGQSGVILDANIGAIEPVPDVAQRAAMDRDYEFQRSQREAAARTRAMAGLRDSLRARGRRP